MSISLPDAHHGASPDSLVPRLAGSRVLVLNWRDVTHPLAGGAEQYMHEIARRWVAHGVDTTWFTSRAATQSAGDTLDGIRIVRSGGTLSLYPRAASWLRRTRGQFDAIVDCQNGIPFFSPLFVDVATPIVQVVHHVHQDQFATRFPAPIAEFGRFLEGPVSRRVYGRRAVAAVSPSTRSEIRRRLRFAGPIHVVPNGVDDIARLRLPRDPDPTIVVVSRLVPHKRIDILLGELVVALEQVPRLRVEIIGDGPERTHLQHLVSDLGLQRSVTLHGYLSTPARDALLSTAWLTVTTSMGEGWGCSVIEAAAWGVPCLALRVPGICDSIVDGRTGWLIDAASGFGPAMVDALRHLAVPTNAALTADRCREWAGRFSWDRSASLLAGVLLEEMARDTSTAERRIARSDIATLIRFRRLDGIDHRAGFRSTDEIAVQGSRVSVLLHGCDEFDAVGVLRRIGAFDGDVHLADRHGVLAGPAAQWDTRDGDETAGLVSS